MFGIKLDKQLRATLTIAAALTVVPVSPGFRSSDNPVNFSHRASGATYAYQDATGRFTVYIRGAQRISEAR